MTAKLISTLIKLTVTGSVMVLVLLLIRFVFKSKLPKMFIVFLWMISFAVFVIPVSLSAPAFISQMYTKATPSYAFNLPAATQNQPTTMHVKQPVKSDVKKARSVADTRQAAAVDPYFVASVIYGLISVTLIVLFSVLYAMTLMRFRKTLPVADNEMFEGLRQKAGVHRKVGLFLSGNTSVPVTVGIIKSRIVLPEGFDLKNRELTGHIYVHELIHVKRCDNAMGLIALFIVCLHWFNPLIWLAYSVFCRDLELACDSGVIKVIGYDQRAKYAESLLKIADKKKKSQPRFVPAFGKYNIKERVTNIMSTQKFSAKIFGVCIISLLVISIAFTAVSCTKNNGAASAISNNSSAGASSTSSHTGSSSAITMTIKANEDNAESGQSVTANGNITVNSPGKSTDSTNGNLMTAQNKKIFQGYIFEYYTDEITADNNGNLLKAPDFPGRISSRGLGDGMLLCSIIKNQSGINLKKYIKQDSAGQWEYVFPNGIGDKILTSCFDIKTVDHSMFTFYNAKSKQYVVSGGSFPDYESDISNVPEVQSIEQEGNNIAVTANFYAVKTYLDSGAKALPNYNKKFQTMKFTFKMSSGKYLIEKVETV